jgi:diguanylate cyclase (GGDEF)-like protein
MGPVEFEPLSDSALRRALERLAARPIAHRVFCLALMAVIGVADYLTGDEVLLFVFQLIPVGILAWGGGKYAGFAGAVIASGIVLVSYVAYSGTFRTIYVWNATVALASTSALAWAVSQLRADRVRIASLLESERRASREDPLTSLATARAFHERLTLELDRMRRHGRPLSLLYMDLDDFKRINDERGHLAGDQLLLRVGKLLHAAVRKIDLCGRLGGDEFGVLMPETGAADAAAVAGRIREGMLKSFREGGASIGMSAGLGTFESPPIDMQMALSQVDQLMYEAKRMGKDRIVSKTFSATVPT